jgi:hypothetical protein
MSKEINRSPKPYRYSDAEWALLSYFVDPSELKDAEPYVVYRIAVGEAFINNTKGPHVEALRRAWLAIHRDNVPRGTAEFDSLVTPAAVVW